MKIKIFLMFIVVSLFAGQETLDNLSTMGTQRTKINANFTELYNFKNDTMPALVSDSTNYAIDSSKTYTDLIKDTITTTYEGAINDTISSFVKFTGENAATISNPDSLVLTEATGIKLANDTRVAGILKATYLRSDSVTKAKVRFADETPIAVVLAGDDTYTRVNNENVYTSLKQGNISNTSNSIVITEAGDYTISLSASIGCDDSNAELHLGIAVNTVVSSFAEREYTSKDAGDVGSLCLTEFPRLLIGDSIYAMVKSGSQTDSIRIKHFNFVIKKDN